MEDNDKNLNIHSHTIPIVPDESVLERLRQRPTITDFQRTKLEQDEKKNWDLFYKRNGNQAYKPRQWVLREFEELKIGDNVTRLLEIGCGCGDFALTLLDKFEDKTNKNLIVYCCDFSKCAIDLLISQEQYKKYHDDHCIKAFQANAKELEELQAGLDGNLVNIITLIFVLSAISPHHLPTVIANVYKLLDKGGVVLFRDYGLYDSAMLRFKIDQKLEENVYFRGDGTRTHFFTREQIIELFTEAGFDILDCCYVRRNTINIGQGLCAPRVFVQLRCRKT